MKIQHFLLCITIALFLGKNSFAQNTKTSMQCLHCNMVIKDKLHNSEAVLPTQQTIHFDAIECLLNYIKDKKTTSFSKLSVADYTNGNLIDATTATYLISDAIKSPMGANLSAFKNKEDALKTQKNKKGKLYNWQEIKAKFANEKVGVIDHQHHHHNRPDAHAPIGVMGDHLHAKGGFMVSFRYMNMGMDGNKSGTTSVNNATIYNNYIVAPQDMKMNMYMLGVMYAPSDNLTLMLMQNFVRKSMNLKARMMMSGMVRFRDFSTSSSGLGDMKLGALYNVYKKENSSVHLNGTLNLPLGSITKRGNTPMMQDIKLPYAMQLGSGTFDVTLGATYKGNIENISWGIQPLVTFRTGKNSENYRFGNSQQVNFWGAYKVSNWVSVSGRFLAISQGKISGKDTQLNSMMVTTANINNYGGEKIKSYLGFNFMFNQNSVLKDFRVGVEAGAPIYENYNGVQMDENLSFNVGLKYSI